MLRQVIVGLAVVGTALAGGGYVMLRNGLAADRAPGAVETAIARRLVVLSIPAATRSTVNPRANEPGSWRSGADHFASHCASCHGAEGRGTAMGSRMYPPVPDLASADIQGLSDGALFAVIENGVRWTGMPSFRAEHDADATWDLVSFIRRLPKIEAADRHAPRAGATGRGQGNAVAMDGTTFTPGTVTVHVGDTVTWTNKDPFPHNVTSPAGGFKSGDLEPDRQWQFRATNTGRFSYVCTLHPGMNGTLIVER
jgi:plastocyanin